MKKRVWITAGLAVVLISGIGMGSTVATFEATAQPVTAEITMDELAIAMNGEKTITLDDAIAGETVEKNLTVENTKTVALYTRVIVDKYWLNEEGEKDYDADASLIELAYNNSDWLVGPESEDEKVVLYYKGILDPAAETTSFLETVTLSRSIGNAYGKKKACIEVSVDAVQSYDGVEAMLDEWGVLATIDGSGNITSVVR